MATSLHASLLDDLKARTRENAALLDAHILHADEARLRHKPSDKAWSAAECIEHLNIVNRHYVSAMQAGIERARMGRVVSIYKPTLMGRFLINLVDPANVKPAKTFGSMVPAVATVDAEDIIKEYTARKATYDALLDAADQLDLNRIKVPSALTSMLKMNLGDVLKLVAYHDRRHLNQGIRAMAVYSG